MWVLSTGNLNSTTKELNVSFYLILTNLNLNGHMQLVATVLDNAELKEPMEVVNAFMKIRSIIYNRGKKH